jgi:hypothetical protein
MSNPLRKMNPNETPRFKEPLPKVMRESTPVQGRPGVFDNSVLREAPLSREAPLEVERRAPRGRILALIT